MRIIELKDIKVEKNLINYYYEVSEELVHFFQEEERFFIEYPVEYDFSDVPYSVLAIPFVMNLLPLAWVSDSLIKVSELDESFYHSLAGVKAGFCKIHNPEILNGGVEYRELVNNDYVPSEESCLLFSGGVDALSATINHIDKHPVLINIWGADIRLSNIELHNEMEKELKDLAGKFNLEYFYIKSSLRFFIKEQELEREFGSIIHDTWWHGMQHSIGMLSLLAPYDYIRKCKYNIIAASFTPASYIDKVSGKIIPCSNYPFIDEKLANVTTKIIHDGFDLKRIEKIRDIVNYSKEKAISIHLKVCFHPIKGQNCSRCEKCYRTIIGIYALGEDPSRFGFEFNKKVLRKIKRFLSLNILGDTVVTLWMEISDYLKAHHSNPKCKWFIDYKFNTGNVFYKRIYLKLRMLARRTVDKLRRNKC